MPENCLFGTLNTILFADFFIINSELKYQSFTKSTKIEAFEQKICMSQNPNFRISSTLYAPV